MATKFNSDADKWLARYQIAKDNQSKMFRRFAKWFDLMYAAINTKDYAPWRSKVFLPILASKAWSMLAKLTALNPGFEVGVYNDQENSEGAEESAQKAQWKLEHDWDNPKFDEPMTDKLFAPLMDALVTGTGVAKTPWCFSENKEYTHPLLDTEDGNVDLSKDIVTTTQNGYNDLIPVNIFNFFVAPGASNLYNAEWVMIKEFKTLEALSESGIYDKKSLDKLKGVRANSDEFAQEKKSRNRLTNSADAIEADDTLDQIELFECYEQSSNTICTYAVGGSKDGKAQWVEIRKQQNPYWHGKYPLVMFYTRKRPYDIWGQGLFEDTERLQNAAMDVFNHFVDSYNLSVNGMISKQEGENYRYVVQPGGELTYRNKPPEQFKFSDPNPGVMQSVITTIESAIEDATISQYATGTPDSATDKTSGTASGIRSLQSAAGDKIAFMKGNYRTSLRLIGSQWLSNNQQFLSRPVSVTGKVNDQPAQVKVTPQDLQIGLVLRINDASMEPVGKQEQLQALMAYKDTLLSLQQASFAQAQIAQTPPLLLNFSTLFEEISEKFGQTNYDKIMVSQDQQPQGAPQMPPQDQQPQQPAPPPPKLPSESLNYKDAPPDIQAQIEAQAGLTPSRTHAMNMAQTSAQTDANINQAMMPPQGVPDGSQATRTNG